MSRTKKMFLILCCTLCLSVGLMCACSAFSVQATTKDFYIRGDMLNYINTDVPDAGVIRQYKSDGSYVEQYLYLTDDLYLMRDTYGVYGFRWSGFSTIGPLYNDYGLYSLVVDIPWTYYDGRIPVNVDGNNTGGVSGESFRVYSLDLFFNCGIMYFRNEEWNDYHNFDRNVSISDGSSSNIPVKYGSGSDLDVGIFHIVNDFETWTSLPQSLSVEIFWRGKPSSNFNPYLEFAFSRGNSIMKATPVEIYYGDVNNQLAAGFNDLKDKLYYDVGNIDVNVDASDVDGFSNFFQSDGVFYNFVSSLTAIGCSVALLGYILHGKK